MLLNYIKNLMRGTYMIIHTFMHILIGAYLYTLFFRPTNNREKIMIILSGGIIGISP